MPAGGPSRLGRALAVLCLFLAGIALGDVFSPGPLAKPHEDLEGLKNCSQCHATGQALSQDTCLACHTELKSRVQAGTGYHGRIKGTALDCEKCHHDHRGKDFNMVEWLPSKKQFPHQDTGWPLKGKHAQTKCESCHTTRLIKAQDILDWLTAHPLQKSTHLGLSSACKACHFDDHRGQLSLSCQNCHNEKGWKPAPGFRHDKTAYPLTGKHKKVACVKCHELETDTETPKDAFPAPVSMRFAHYKDLAFQSCLDCHKDPHDGKFGERCESCHTTEGWKVMVNGPQKDTTFHDDTRYPLRGLHALVPCKSCHGPFPGQPAKFKNMAFKYCTDCHADSHERQLAQTHGPGPACERCHTIDGFRPSTYTAQEHQKSRYPLEGAHEAVACLDCHKNDPKLLSKVPPALHSKLVLQKRKLLFSETLFLIPGKLDRCETCHADPHAGQFQKGGTATPCTACHKLSSFHQLTFDHQKDSRFPLLGKHSTAACAACHKEVPLKGTPTVRYRPLDMACDSCHADAHAGQFRTRGGAQACEQCHDANSWKAALFQHGPPFTTYVLDGKHQTVECIGCHPDVNVGAAKPVRKYLHVPTTCEGCHEDFHKGEFKGFLP
jgi:hypothetical protein